ncbi:hypothetical protein UUU_43240 [Klebsiella pneumoniae subsp. pneumoniae DSM 30104 = JCM 1662 = NBRC 14940]|nr:hypothetical protein UUU_43240 [Klebsiella pneumoniae subsp. pneumoniae DSM 30104 = JCM 1662 = NBRC 14940]
MQMLVSTLQQTHHIFLTLFLFFIFIIVREAELLHQLINAIQFGVHPALLFSIKGAALFQTFQQRVQALIILQQLQLSLR